MVPTFNKPKFDIRVLLLSGTKISRRGKEFDLQGVVHLRQAQNAVNSRNDEKRLPNTSLL